MALFDLRSAYLYLVCLITLVIFIAGTIFSVNNLMDVALGEEGYYQTYEDFAQRYEKFNEDSRLQQPTLSEDQIKTRYEEYVAVEKKRQRNRNIRDLVSSLSAMLVAGGFWRYHWRKIQMEKEE